MWQMYKKRKEEQLKPSLDPPILAWEICWFTNLCFFDCCCSLVIQHCLLLVCLSDCCFVYLCACFCVCVCIPACRHGMFGERKCETDSYDSYFNLFREYCCTGAVHWVAPACQVCLIMQKEQKNALQMSEFLPKETEIWQTSSTLREQWCKIHYCQM